VLHLFDRNKNEKVLEALCFKDELAIRGTTLITAALRHTVSLGLYQAQSR